VIVLLYLSRHFQNLVLTLRTRDTNHTSPRSGRGTKIKNVFAHMHIHTLQHTRNAGARQRHIRTCRPAAGRTALACALIHAQRTHAQ
jgi:hypothetical protein